MTAEQRRSRISTRLHEAQQPISATVLARELGVSRQIIVGDVALLRAGGQAITATARGYVIPAPGDGTVRQVACRHDGAGTRDELNAMVDCGCTVIDVIVDHPVYGQLSAPLHLHSRLDVEQFMNCSTSRRLCRCSGADSWPYTGWSTMTSMTVQPQSTMALSSSRVPAPSWRQATWRTVPSPGAGIT